MGIEVNRLLYPIHVEMVEVTRVRRVDTDVGRVDQQVFDEISRLPAIVSEIVFAELAYAHTDILKRIATQVARRNLDMIRHGATGRICAIIHAQTEQTAAVFQVDVLTVFFIGTVDRYITPADQDFAGQLIGYGRT